MAVSLSATAPADRPRERLWLLGPGALTTTELLAVLLGSGSPRLHVMALAEHLLAMTGGSLRGMMGRASAELLQVEGVGPAKAGRLVAAFEIARRSLGEPRPTLPRIRMPEDVVRLLGPSLRDLPIEEFHLLALDTQHQVVRDVLITRGLLDSSLVHPREVFRAAIVEAAAAVIVVHNHPSGDPTPSADDRAITRQLVAAGRLLDVPLHDHVIIAGDRFVSFASLGLL